jgi:hypothetical protein
MFKEVLLTYPRAIELSNLTKLGATLKIECEKFDTLSCENWFNSNSGPLPSEEMPNRVAEQTLILVVK